MQAQKLFPKKLIYSHFYIDEKFKQALRVSASNLIVFLFCIQLQCFKFFFNFSKVFKLNVF